MLNYGKRLSASQTPENTDADSISMEDFTSNKVEEYETYKVLGDFVYQVLNVNVKNKKTLTEIMENLVDVEDEEEFEKALDFVGHKVITMLEYVGVSKSAIEDLLDDDDEVGVSEMISLAEMLAGKVDGDIRKFVVKALNEVTEDDIRMDSVVLDGAKVKLKENISILTNVGIEGVSTNRNGNRVLLVKNFSSNKGISVHLLEIGFTDIITSESDLKSKIKTIKPKLEAYLKKYKKPFIAAKGKGFASQMMEDDIKMDNTFYGSNGECMKGRGDNKVSKKKTLKCEVGYSNGKKGFWRLPKDAKKRASGENKATSEEKTVIVKMNAKSQTSAAKAKRKKSMNARVKAGLPIYTGYAGGGKSSSTANI